MIAVGQNHEVVRPRRRMLIFIALALGFCAALYARILIGGYNAAGSILGGLFFAVCLYGLAFAAGTKIIMNRRIARIGALGGLFLCLPAIVIHFIGGGMTHSGGNYLTWALAVTVVVMAEEAFLRGALFDAVNSWLGQTAAVVIAAVAFAALHVPLYGWHVVPLDMAVGLWLGALRVISGSFVAPGIAHLIADLVGWWL
jgi:membrane protease YdiL (CAAX protease family)